MLSSLGLCRGYRGRRRFHGELESPLSAQLAQDGEGHSSPLSPVARPLPPPHLPQRRRCAGGELGVLVLGEVFKDEDGVLGGGPNDAEVGDDLSEDHRVRAIEGLDQSCKCFPSGLSKLDPRATLSGGARKWCPRPD